MEKFNPLNKEHRAIVIAAMLAADQFGAGRISAAREQLELNDVSVDDVQEFHRYIFAWGAGL